VKKLVLILFLIAGFSVISVSAWEPGDLTTFPSCMDENSWIMNLGVGLDSAFFTYVGNELYLAIPPVRITLDKNAGIGDRNLPFFFGGLVGYSGWGWRNYYFNHRIPVGFRAGYHFNWGVDGLDTYIVTTAGWIVNIRTGDNRHNPRSAVHFADDFIFDIKLGARWFIGNVFGFWAEAGYGNTPSYADIGLSFKF